MDSPVDSQWTASPAHALHASRHPRERVGAQCMRARDLWVTLLVGGNLRRRPRGSPGRAPQLDVVPVDSLVLEHGGDGGHSRNARGGRASPGPRGRALGLDGGGWAVSGVPSRRRPWSSAAGTNAQLLQQQQGAPPRPAAPAPPMRGRQHARRPRTPTNTRTTIIVAGLTSWPRPRTSRAPRPPRARPAGDRAA